MIEEKNLIPEESKKEEGESFKKEVKQAGPEEKEEKLEFLKRAEVRTMQKDIKRLRETEVEKERERIIGLETEKKKTKAQPEQEREKVARETLIPKPPKRPASSRKFLVRIGFILLSVLIIGFFYWFFVYERAIFKDIFPSKQEITPLKEELVLPEEELPSEREEEMEEEIAEEPEIIIPLINERILDWGYYIPTATRTIDTIIIHSVYNAIGGDVYDMERVIEQFRMYKVTSHYLITRDGTIYQLSPDEAVAYHAGAGKMPDGSRIDIINNFSVGIELIYTKTESPNETQYQSLSQLVNYLRQQYNIPLENILGQNEIAPERKTDPWNFDWEYFYPLIEE
ncbi:MAG: N-acetylmuramoyl-L-alanine amidase [Candidatus Nealsonbacteria bacterium]